MVFRFSVNVLMNGMAIHDLLINVWIGRRHQII